MDNIEDGFKCMRCGHELETDNILARSDIFPNVEPESDQDAMVMVAHCPHCGISYELYDTPDCEKDEYDYWTAQGADPAVVPQSSRLLDIP